MKSLKLQVLLVIISIVVCIYIFWAMNAPERFLFRKIGSSDLYDLAAVVCSAGFGSFLIWSINRIVKRGLLVKWILSILVWLAFAFSFGWYYFSHLNNIPLASSSFFRIDLPLSVILFAFWALFFLSKAHPGRLTKTVKPLTSQEENDLLRITGWHGNSKIFLRIADIRIIYMQHRICYTEDREKNRFTVRHSIGELEKLLPHDEFFRINRQCIVSRSSVKGFEYLENKKLKVIPDAPPGPSVNMNISRDRAPSFKIWVGN